MRGGGGGETGTLFYPNAPRNKATRRKKGIIMQVWRKKRDARIIICSMYVFMYGGVSLLVMCGGLKKEALCCFIFFVIFPNMGIM